MYPSYNESNYFQLTAEFVQHTGKHIFLTGKAGTGKTTFLKHIKETSGKRLVVIAPTGVAAINAGGVTMHSFFQLPLGCFIPGSFRNQFQSDHAVTDRHHLLHHLRYSNEKIELMRNLELLIIDEVSMLRCDWLDALDILLRHVRRNQREPFGGVQLLFIGDLYQLPPVVNEQEWALLREYYATPFFFSALVLKQTTPLCIELKKVYRQSDEEFIHLLNRVRNNEVIDEDLHRLGQLYKPDFKPNASDQFITLTTHNYKADEINARELKRLPGKEYISKAGVTGEFPERVFPVEQSLLLKEGAQVMFIKNDVKDKKYFNGRIGIFSGSFQNEEGVEQIKVLFPETKETITVEKETWRNIRYSFNERDNKIEEEELGAFIQYPIRLAWAVTIHKSQGLTFKKAVIDAGSAFAAGQVYVALSRCVSLDGMVLLSPIRREAIRTDEAIVAYMSEQTTANQLQEIFQKEREIYSISTAMNLFDMNPMVEKIYDFIIFMGARKSDQKEKIISGLQAVHQSLLSLNDVSQKFREQVRQITAGGLSDSASMLLDERVSKAKKYFAAELDEKLIASLKQVNKELLQLNKVRKILKAMKVLMDFAEHFTGRYRFRQVAAPFEANKETTSGSHSEQRIDSSASNELIEILKAQRKKLAEEENLPPFRICNDATLNEIVMYLPQTLNEMALIKGMGDFALGKYGEPFLLSVQDFSNRHGLKGKIHLKHEKVRTKQNRSNGKINQAAGGIKDGSNSQMQSFQLFQSGKSISEIAEIRNFAEGTIQAHLAHFITTGEIDVFTFVSEEKFELIREAIQKVTSPGLGAIKNSLGEEISYADIRFTIAALKKDQKVAST